MARTDPQINLRVPADLKKKIELIAVENSRSINAEVVQRLEQSFEQKFEDIDSVPTEELMKELAKRCTVLEIKMR
jgi:hypothetical protein